MPWTSQHEEERLLGCCHHVKYLFSMSIGIGNVDLETLLRVTEGHLVKYRINLSHVKVPSIRALFLRRG